MTEPSPDASPPPRVEGLEEAFRAAKEEEFRLRGRVRLLTLGLFLVVVGCLTSLVVRAAKQYGPRQFEPHARRELARLVPLLGRNAMGVVEEVRPEYVRLAREEFQKTLAPLRATAAEECQRLGDSLRKRAEGQIERTLERLEARQWERLKAEFPVLADAAAQARYRERWKSELVTNGREVVLDFHERFGRDVQKLWGTVQSFRPNPCENMSEDRLHREFLHLCLMLVDRQVMAPDEGKGGAGHGR